MSKIEFKDVSFSYQTSGKNKIIDHMNVSFSSDKITVLTGPSGCGKSTVLSLAAGIYPQNAGVMQNGEVLVHGQRVASLPPEKRCQLVGMMFQNPDLQFCMDTVEHELFFCLGNIATAPEQMLEIVDKVLKFCDIEHLRSRKLSSLSGGEKQKAMLASIIALRPKWIILDEPFANIDEVSARSLTQKVAKLHKTGIGILVVDHRLDHWMPIADEIRIMDSKSGINEVAYKPEELTSKKLMEIGVISPNGHYKTCANMRNQKDTPPILTIENLTVTRDKKSILNNLSVAFQREKIYAIMGQSGSGKSTLFKAINGLYSYKGKIRLDVENMGKRFSKKTGIVGFVTQNPQDQFVAGTVQKEIEISLRHRSEETTNKDLELILRDVNLWGYRNFSPYMLSQGQQRRLGVAALMAYDCQVLICDEPTYAQDRNNTIAIMDRLVEKVRKEAMTLIFSTHDDQLAQDYADIILQLKEGGLHEVSKSSL